MPKRTSGVGDIASACVPASLEELRALLDQVSKPIVKKPLAAALSGGAVIRLQLGLAGRRQLLPCISRGSQTAPNLTKSVFAFLRARCPLSRATSVTVAWHRMAPLHMDLSNLGLSYVAALGCRSGGQLWVADGTPAGTALDVTSGIVEFSSLMPHRTLRFAGSRCYISFYTHHSVLRVQRHVRRQLCNLGVPAPTRAEALAMAQQRRLLPPPRVRAAAAQNAWRVFAAACPSLVPRSASSEHRLCSWVCRHCGNFGLHVRGQPRRWCGATCRKRAQRLAKSRQLKPKRCKACGRVVAVAGRSPGRPPLECLACRGR